MKRLAHVRRIAAAGLVAGICLLVVISAASAAPPANDRFASAQPIAGASGSVSGTNVEATKEPGEPDHAEDVGGRSVWYRWTAPSSGDFVFDTCGSGFDTLLAVYTGATVSALTEVTSNDDSCAEQSFVLVSATAGAVYSIVVDGYRDVEAGIGTGAFTLRWRQVTAPPNDDFAAAQPLSGDRGTVEGDNLAARPEPGERPPVDALGASVWYSWTPPFTGAVAFETCGNSSFDTVLAVYTGASVASLTRIAVNDDRCQLQSRVRFLARAGTAYRILVDGIDERPRGFFTLSWTLVRRPVNDDFAAARRISGVRGSVSGTNQGALREANEPAHAGFEASASMWYRWRAPRSMGVSFDTCTSNFDTLLAVYRGRALRRLVRLDADDDSCPPTGSRVDVVATKGVEYLIAVDGLLDTTGTFTLRWRPAGASAAPCRVPDVRGLTVSRARQALEGAGCRLGRVVSSHSRLVPRGRVISQSPAAGRRVRFLTRVSVEVSLGRGP